MKMGGMTNLRSSLVLAATLGLLMSATVASADQTSDEVPRGIRISAAGKAADKSTSVATV